MVGWRLSVFQTHRAPPPLSEQRNFLVSAPCTRTLNACRRDRCCWAAAAPEREGHWQAPVAWVVQALGLRRLVAGSGVVASHAIGCGTFSYLRLVERVVHRYSILHVLVMCGCSAGWRESQQREQEGESDKHIWSFIGTTTSMRGSWGSGRYARAELGTRKFLT